MRDDDDDYNTGSCMGRATGGVLMSAEDAGRFLGRFMINANDVDMMNTPRYL